MRVLRNAGFRWSSSLLIVSASLVVPFLAGASDASPPALQACAASQVKVSESTLGQVGNYAVQVFTIRNVGRSTCGMQGYPNLTFFTSNRLDQRVRVVHDASLYADAPARLLAIGPGSEVSFGLAYRESTVSSKDELSSCLVQSVLIQIPLASAASGDFAYHDSFNVCQSGDVVAVSPVEGRSRPKLASL